MTFQIKGVAEMSANNQINEGHDESYNEGNDGDNSTEWLNLSLGRHGDIVGSKVVSNQNILPTRSSPATSAEESSVVHKHLVATRTPTKGRGE
ncbi:hypothetical protein CRYUN_Cryun28dG0076400 [Craigia yunnanensis]